MSCPGEGSSFLAPRTCPSWVFTVDLFFGSTLWMGDLLAQTSQFRDMLRLLILGLSDMHKILHLKTNGFSNQLMGGMSVLCKHKRWIIELTAFSGMGSVVWSIIYDVHSGKKKKMRWLQAGEPQGFWSYSMFKCVWVSWQLLYSVTLSHNIWIDERRVRLVRSPVLPPLPYWCGCGVCPLKAPL